MRRVSDDGAFVRLGSVTARRAAGASSVQARGSGSGGAAHEPGSGTDRWVAATRPRRKAVAHFKRPVEQRVVQGRRRPVEGVARGRPEDREERKQWFGLVGSNG